MSDVPEFNPVHARVYADSFVSFDLLSPHRSGLIGAVHNRLRDGISAVTTIQMILGVDEETASEVALWVACDPHDHDRDPVMQLVKECEHLREFEFALYSRMTREGFAWT